MLGLIFRKAQNKIQDPAKLRQIIVELIGKEDWLSISSTRCVGSRSWTASAAFVR